MHATVVRRRDRDADEAEEGSRLTGRGRQLRHVGGAELPIEGGRGIAVAAAGPVSHRDLAVDPGLPTVERGEEPGRDALDDGRAVECEEVVVRPGQQVIRVCRVRNDRRFVVRTDRLVTVQVDIGQRIAAGRAGGLRDGASA